MITSSQSPTSPDPEIALGGLLGCPILCNNLIALNYRDTILTIGSTPAIDGVLPEIKLPFAFEGGGSSVQINGATVPIPKSRIIVDVMIESISYRMMVDTGASEVTVDADTYSAITADGRAQLTSGGVETASGESSASYTRTNAMSLGGATATGVVVAHDTSFDQNLASLSTDAGETVHGSLGGSFLNHFYLTIDYPGTELHLAPYQDTSFVYDTAEIVGIELGAGLSTGYSIAGVVPGTDAARKGASPGDIIVAIDGTSVARVTHGHRSRRAPRRQSRRDQIDPIRCCTKLGESNREHRSR